MTYAIETLEDNGDLVDIHYFCGQFCSDDAERRVLAAEQVYNNGRARFAFTEHICPETDYDVWCAECGDFLWHGIECECDDTSVDREPVEIREGELIG